MDFEALFSQYSPLLRKYWFTLALALFGLIFFGYGLISLLGSSSKDKEVVFTHEDLATKSASLINVDVEGAVIKPGVYKLAQDSIVQDALLASEGLAEDADRDFVSKNINLAAKLSEGAKIYIPRVGENALQTQNSSFRQAQDKIQNLININTASIQELDSLQGVGPVTAQKIIDNRPYANLNDLLDKKVVSAKVFEQIKDKITLY